MGCTNKENKVFESHLKIFETKNNVFWPTCSHNPKSSSVKRFNMLTVRVINRLNRDVFYYMSLQSTNYVLNHHRLKTLSSLHLRKTVLNL